MIDGPAMRSVPGRQLVHGQGPPPARGPHEGAGPGPGRADAGEHEHHDDEAGDRDASTGLRRTPRRRGREQDPEDDGDDAAAQPAQRTHLVRGQGGAGLRVLAGRKHVAMLSAAPVAGTT